MKTFLVTALFLCSPFASFIVAGETTNSKAIPSKTLPIYIKQEFHKDKSSFFVWIDCADATVENTAPDITVAFNVIDGALYLASDTAGNAMIFVHPYGEKSHPTRLIVRFGGIRHNDINLYLPENTQAKIDKSYVGKRK